MLVYEINSVNGGIVRGEIVALINAGEEIALPKDAISVLDKKGKMLAAKFKEVKHNGSSDVLNFALGAAKETRDLISQPNSSFSSISQFGQSQGTNFENKNYPGAILSGGTTEVLEDRLSEVQRRRNTSPLTSFWQIEADTKITLQTNYTFKY